MMIASDLDGTLMGYSYIEAERVNWEVITHWRDQGVTAIAIVSNQGGLALGVEGALRADGRPYPTPWLFADRFAALVVALGRAGIAIPHARVCVYHPRADARAIRKAERAARFFLQAFCADAVVYATARSRKPAPLMLRSVGATVYYGDSDEDAEAAHNAGIPFVRVPRFE